MSTLLDVMHGNVFSAFFAGVRMYGLRYLGDCQHLRETCVALCELVDSRIDMVKVCWRDDVAEVLSRFPRRSALRRLRVDLAGFDTKVGPWPIGGDVAGRLAEVRELWVDDVGAGMRGLDAVAAICAQCTGARSLVMVFDDVAATAGEAAGEAAARLMLAPVLAMAASVTQLRLMGEWQRRRCGAALLRALSGLPSGITDLMVEEVDAAAVPDLMRRLAAALPRLARLALALRVRAASGGVPEPVLAAVADMPALRELSLVVMVHVHETEVDFTTARLLQRSRGGALASLVLEHRMTLTLWDGAAWAPAARASSPAPASCARPASGRASTTTC
jgi:hypothetical protein